METIGIISKLVLASLVVWRLTRLLCEDAGFGHPSRLVRSKPEELLGSRVMDCLYWVSVWWSAQTAIWVACGLAGVLANWLLVSGVIRLIQRPLREGSAPVSFGAGAANRDLCGIEAERNPVYLDDPGLPEGQASL